MLINEVQYKLGLTKKSIRYYEEEGLLKPKRNSRNDYREYDEEDIKDLQLIKFLRSLDVPICEIKKLKNNSLTLKECMEERIKRIEQLENNFRKVKDMCLDIIDSNAEFHNIDITKYSLEMNVLGKRGFVLNKIKKSDNKKILGACLSSFFFSIFFIALIILFTYLLLTDNTFPLVMYLFLVVLFGLPILGIAINLFKRIKEIRGGEENEASKY